MFINYVTKLDCTYCSSGLVKVAVPCDQNCLKIILSYTVGTGWDIWRLILKTFAKNNYPPFFLI